jgi:hypothetical protein
MRIFEDVLKPIVDFLLEPEKLLPLSALLLVLVLKHYRTVTQPRVAGALGLLALAGFVASLFNPNFAKIITKPDNIPIVLLVASVGFFLWLSLRRAAVNDERAERNEPPLEAAHRRETVLVWPDLVMVEFICLLAVSAVLVFWSVGIRAPLEEPASAALTPNPSKAPWYFLGLQEMLVYFDPWLAGVVLPTLIIVGLMAIPYVDVNPRGNGYYTLKERRFAITVFLFGFLIFWVVLIFIGTFLRGANWNFFGLYDAWDPHKQVPLKNIDVSEIVWVKMLGQGRPQFWLKREIVGILLVLGYFTLGPAILAKTVLKPLYRPLGFVRFSIVAMLLLCMVAMPIKMLGRWLFNLKYVVYIPEYFFNI